MQRIGKTIFGWVKDSLKYLQVEEKDHDIGLLEVINPEARPIEVREALNHPIKTKPGLGNHNISNDSGNVTTLSGAAAAVTVPVKGARYLMIAMGSDMYVTQNGTAASGCAGLPCPDKTPIGPIPLYRDLSVFGTGKFYLIRVIE
jgi:hypothetical protein